MGILAVSASVESDCNYLAVTECVTAGYDYLPYATASEVCPKTYSNPPSSPPDALRRVQLLERRLQLVGVG